MNEYITGIAEAGYDVTNPAHVADYLSDLRHDLAILEAPYQLHMAFEKQLAAEIREAIEYFTPCAHNNPAGNCPVCHKSQAQLNLL